MLCSRVLTPGSSAQRPVPHESVPGHPAQIPRQANEAWWHAALVVATKQRARITSPPLRHSVLLPSKSQTPRPHIACKLSMPACCVRQSPASPTFCALAVSLGFNQKQHLPCRRFCARNTGTRELVSHGGGVWSGPAGRYTPSLHTASPHAPWPRATVLARAATLLE